MGELRILVGILGLAVLIAGCGADGGSATPESASSTPQPTRPSIAQTSTTPNAGSLTIILVYLPVCGPSSPSPPDCEPEPLPDVEVVVATTAGATMAQGVTDDSGEVTLNVPPGDYIATGAAVSRATTPRPAPVSVTAGESALVTIRYESNLQ